MFKIGDKVQSFNEVDVPSKPFGRCRYCNNLSRPTEAQGSIFRGQEVSLKNLCNESWNRDCPWCAILARCIKLLEPETSKMVEAEPDRPMWCFINRHNSISIRWHWTNMQVTERCSFQLYRSPNTEPLPDGLDIPTCPELVREPGHEHMWDYLRQCLMKCLWSHSECRKAQQLNWFPKRLLYLENTGGAFTEMRVVLTDEHHPSGPYIALSHCWGVAQPLRSLTENIATFQKHIDSAQLSAVFRDCVTSAKQFGVNYIWIDSLCIIQDDRADWNAHAQQMDKIYENAIIVIAAVSSENGSLPFLGPKAPNKRHLITSHPVELSALPETLGSIRARCYGEDADLTALKGPLRHRAWAWQEHVLSTRIIHFTESQCIWECLQARGSEMMGSMEPRNDAMKTRMCSTQSIERVWQQAIHDYGKRSLTYVTDRLPAMSGVASRFQPLLKTEYIAGLWRQRMVLDLAWERSGVLSVADFALKPSLDNSVPSWSWASIHGSASYGLQHYFSEVRVEYSVTDIDCEPISDNSLGEVRYGSSIQVEGRYVPAKLITDERGFAVIERNGFKPQLVTPDCRLVEALRTTDGTEIGIVRRALPPEKYVSGENKSAVPQQKISGAVVCLLLLSGTPRQKNVTKSAVVLILAQLGPDAHVMQRVALGRGGPDKLGSLRKGGETFLVPWQWTIYETWEKWEDWFADATKGRIRLF